MGPKKLRNVTSAHFFVTSKALIGGRSDVFDSRLCDKKLESKENMTKFAVINPRHINPFKTNKTMTEEEQEARRREMEAELAANEEADRMRRRNLIRGVIIGAVVIIAAIVAISVFYKPGEPEVYTDQYGDVDYVKQADKLRRSGKWKEVYAFHAGYAPVSDGKKYGLVDVHGTLLVPIKYDEVSSFNDPYPDLSLVKVGDKYGLVNKQGKEVLAPEYDNIDVPTGSIMKVKKGQEEFYVDLNGKRVNMN
jgi:hypothetical protein